MNPNKRIIHVLVVVCLMFLSLMSYLLYFNMFQSSAILGHSENPRRREEEQLIKRGSIYDSTGMVLAETEEAGGERRYPHANLYSHVIGYCSPTYEKNNLEKTYNKYLLGYGDNPSFFSSTQHDGYDLHLTIDHSLQLYAYEQLRGNQGAIVALEPTTGRVLAMVSLPDFDPTTESLEENWDALNADTEGTPFVPRATMGWYPPGSTYKIATTAAAYENGMTGRIFQDTGVFERDGMKVRNYGGTAHGTIDLEKAFIVSSNYAFCELGYDLGPEKVKSNAEKFGIGKDIDFDIPTKQSQIQYEEMYPGHAAQVSIGQGQLVMTPLNVAMMGAAVANDGKMMKPYLVDKITTASGTAVKTFEPQLFSTAMSPSCAAYIDDLMRKVVESGTGRSAQISGTSVAGKTGTAESGKTGRDHAWFVGYAPADNPKIAVAVILEYDGTSGGTTAAPIARNVMKEYLGK